MGRLLLILGGLLLVSFVAMVGLQAGGGLKVWGLESRQFHEDGSKNGFGVGLHRLWLRKGSTVYVDFATEIHSGALFIRLKEMPSLGERPSRPIERRITASNVGTINFRIRKDGMYQLLVEAHASTKWSSKQPKMRYKVKWGLDNSAKDRTAQKLAPIK